MKNVIKELIVYRHFVLKADYKGICPKTTCVLVLTQKRNQKNNFIESTTISKINTSFL